MRYAPPEGGGLYIAKFGVFAVFAAYARRGTHSIAWLSRSTVMIGFCMTHRWRELLGQKHRSVKQLTHPSISARLDMALLGATLGRIRAVEGQC
jgi:hypothetical protein